MISAQRTNGTAVDPITFEIVRHRLWAINDEQAMIAARMSGSPVVYEVYDFNAGLLTATGEGLVAGVYILHHATTLGFFVKRVITEWEHDEIHEGDMFFTNDPWWGALHSSDGILVTPIFWEGQIVGWSGIAMHDDDVGSPVPGSFVVGAGDRFDEAPLIPGVRMVENFRFCRDIEATFLNNTRTPEANALNLRARLAALTTTHRRIHELIRQYGVEVLIACQDQLLAQVEDGIRRRLRDLPDGTWLDNVYVDHDGNENRLYPIRCALTKVGERLIVDFAGTAPQAPGPINCARPATEGAVSGVVLMLVCHDLTWSVGAVSRVVEIISAPGTLNNAVPPAATSMASIMGALGTQAAVSSAFAKMLLASTTQRGEAQACWSAGPNCLVFAGVDADGQPFTNPDENNCGGGAGARTFADGLDTGGIFHSVSAAIPNVETTESRTPVLVVYRRQCPDSGGHGRFRGGLGLELAVVPHRAGAPVMHVVLAQSVSQPDGHGLAGGTPAAVNSNLVLRGSNIAELFAQGRIPRSPAEIGRQRLEVLAAKDSSLLDGERGDLFLTVVSGGGGYGDPLRRAPQRVLADVQARLLSQEQADAVYGVVIADGDVDDAATASRRESIRNLRLSEARSVAPRERRRIVGGEILHPVADVLEAVQHDGTRSIRCTVCEEWLADYGADYKLGALMREMPISELTPLNSFAPETGVVVREFYCPGCGTALTIDIQLADEDVAGECTFTAGARP